MKRVVPTSAMTTKAMVANKMAKSKAESKAKMSLPNFKAAPKPKPQLSQRDRYGKAMAGATKRGGSNGVGVGH